MIQRTLLFAAFLLATSSLARGQFIDATGGGSFKTYPSKYYVIRTDLPAEEVREVALRMTKMAEEYHARTAGFSGQINERLPFLLFEHEKDYLDAGGMVGSAGVFNGERLMAISGEHPNAGAWHTVQHEGFHQFAHAVIHGQIPAWANEGLAEYFGEAQWTGDGFVAGLIPEGRRERIVKEMDEPDTFKSIPEMMQLSYDAWNGKLTMANYDQGWSMTYFLAHGDDGKYQQPFNAFMRDLGHGKVWQKAWLDNFGSAAGFETRWRDYWHKLPKNPTLVGYMNATTATLASFIGRSFTQKQTFADFPAFTAAADANQIKIADTDWLPISLAQSAVKLAAREGVWSIGAAANKQPTVVCEMEDGTRLVGNFKLAGGHVTGTNVEIDDLKPTLAKAKDLLAAGKKNDAHDLVQASLRQHGTSPSADEAKKFLAANR